MSGRTKRNRTYFSWMASILLLFSLFAPAVSLAEGNDQQVDAAGQAGKAKINERLREQFEQEDEVTFLVKFKEKADTGQAAKEAGKQAAKKDLSANESELMQRSAVVSELKSTAMSSQESVRDYLENEVEKENATDVHPYYIVNGMAITATEEVAEKVASFVEVDKLLPDETREIYETDDMKSETTDDGDIEWNVDRINAPDAWSNGIDGSGTVVASIDTGAQWDHPALKENYRGYDPKTGDADHDFNWFDATSEASEPYDDVGHGTHVTGTMAGGEADGSNQIGVAPGADWISVKAFTEQGGKDTDLLDAAEWILAPEDEDGNTRVDMAPDVVNNSWSGGQGMDEWYRDVVKAWRDAHIFPEFSAGNTDLSNPGGPGSIASPANYPESFATGATDQEDNVADFSLRGPSPYDEIKPDIAAPGVNIRSSVPGDDYGSKNGTSMAGPAVAGVVALLRQADAGVSVNDMEEILMDTATARTDEEYPEVPNNGYGHGLVDAFEAVAYITDGLGAVEGTVAESGEDNEAPEFSHDAPQVVYENMNTDFSIHATDNVSIVAVEFHYQINDGEEKLIEADRVDGDHTDGEYEVSISGEELEEGTLSYHWVIKDYGGNDVTSDDYEVSIDEGITTGYYEDFAEEPAGWYSVGENDSWEWGEPESGPEEAKTGENVYGTNLDGPYDNDADATLMMPAVDLPEGESYLQFDWWHDLEAVHDYAWVYVSTDQEEWKSEKVGFYDTDGWERNEIDLSDYSGERIYIGFNLESKVEEEVEKPGIYLDNVGLSSTSEDSSKASLMDNQGASAVNESPTDKNADTDKSSATEKTEGSEEEVSPVDLPLQAEVSVQEIGRSTKTNPSDGSYSLSSIVPGDYTLEADAYGYYPETEKVRIAEEETTSQDFTLEEKPQGTVSGTVTDQDSGAPIEGATLFLMEDANISPVDTDADGSYDLTAYEGTYTMKVIANGYHYGEKGVTIDADSTELDVALEPFCSYREDEIYYDDGSMERGWAFYDSGISNAVRMSLPEDQETAFVTDGVFQFDGPQFQDPDGGAFAVEVWDSSGVDGMPGEKLAGPIEADAVRDPDEWTVIDLRDENIIVDDDFYMVYVQTEENEYAPLLGIDEDEPYAGRSYEREGGIWTQLPADEGNYMIRARVSYEVEEPAISSPDDGAITNEETVTVEGTATPDEDVKLLNDDEAADVVTANGDGAFTADVNLDEGDNELSAITLVDGEETKTSDPVTVTRDTIAPDLAITYPEDGEQTTRETVTVKGEATDDNLASVHVNNQEADVDEDGTYDKRIMLENGKNEIEVSAADEAGNEATETVTLDVKYDAPEVENVLPDEAVHVSTGETVQIELDSEEDATATFSVHMPLTHGQALANATELPMMETSDGHYVGHWTIPSGAVADGAIVEVKVQDDYGNETRQKADGKLFINQDADEDASGKIGLRP